VKSIRFVRQINQFVLINASLGHFTTGGDPYSSLKLIHDLNLYTSIFAPPLDTLPELSIYYMILAANAIQRNIASRNPSRPRLPSLLDDNPERYMVWLNAALTPWESQVLPFAKKGLPAAAVVAKEGLKVNNHITGIVSKSYAHVECVRDAMPRVGEWDRGKVGMFLRNLGQEWRCPVACSLVLELVKTGGGEDGIHPTTPHSREKL
jgi:hypothetical protein